MCVLHSAAVNGVLDEYGDGSGAMGACCSSRCHNTPQAWQLGWMPVFHVTGNELWAGDTLTFNLQPAVQRGSRGVRITPDWSDGAIPLYLGFRDTEGKHPWKPASLLVSLALTSLPGQGYRSPT